MTKINQGSKHIHLIGICGTAMASLAGMLQARGHRITGSDAAAYPPMSDVLAGLGIPLMQPYAEANLDPRPDLVIVGNAISRGNVELEFVLDTRIPFTSMAAVLHDEFLAGRESLVVAGTHGKTTTTSMLAWIYEVVSRTRPELAPSFLIGGVAENFGTSFMVRPEIDGVRQPFLLEGDEYDTAFFDKGPKFLHYFPDAAILTHVEFDHADIYVDLAAVKTAFRRLVNLIPRRGRLVAYDGSENVSECVARAFCTVERYGFRAESHWRLTDLRHEGTESRWTLLRGGTVFCRAAAADGGRAQCAECDGCGSSGCWTGRSCGGDCGGAGDLPLGEATAGGARRGERGDDHRGLRAPSDGDPRDAAGAAHGLSGAAVVGCAGAAVEYAAAQCF